MAEPCLRLGILRNSFAWKHGDKVSIIIKREDKELTKVSKVISPKVNETFITVNPDASKKAKNLGGAGYLTKNTSIQMIHQRRYKKIP